MRTTTSRLGWERPVSTKLMCLGEIPDLNANFMSRFDQGHSGNPIAVSIREDPDDVASVGMAYEHEGTGNGGPFQERRQFIRHGPGGAAPGTAVAPTHASPVVRAHPDVRHEQPLYLCPMGRPPTRTRFDHDAGIARSPYQVEAVSPDVHARPRTARVLCRDRPRGEATDHPEGTNTWSAASHTRLQPNVASVAGGAIRVATGQDAHPWPSSDDTKPFDGLD